MITEKELQNNLVEAEKLLKELQEKVEYQKNEVLRCKKLYDTFLEEAESAKDEHHLIDTCYITAYGEYLKIIKKKGRYYIGKLVGYSNVYNDVCANFIREKQYAEDELLSLKVGLRKITNDAYKNDVNLLIDHALKRFRITIEEYPNKTNLENVLVCNSAPRQYKDDYYKKLINNNLTVDEKSFLGNYYMASNDTTIVIIAPICINHSCTHRICGPKIVFHKNEYNEISISNIFDGDHVSTTEITTKYTQIDKETLDKYIEKALPNTNE